MKIKRLSMDEFTAFSSAVIEFSEGLNVFIGENATGKSHAMKLAYCMVKALEAPTGRGQTIDPQLTLKQKLAAVFMPDDGKIRRLPRRARGQKCAVVSMQMTDARIRAEVNTQGRCDVEAAGYPLKKRCVFIPSREALAMYDGFIQSYEDRELSFDETYYDLCRALSGKPLRGARLGNVRELIEGLEDIIGGKVTLEGNRFHVTSEQGIIEAHLLAEGHRKIASIVHLINNGALMKNGILFWDEPEANLNPKLITRVAEVLRALVQHGMQVIVATHDYLLSHELSLAVEYGLTPKIPTRFFAFSRQGNKPVIIEAGDTLADLSENPILEEFAAHYERARNLFAQESTAGRGVADS